MQARMQVPRWVVLVCLLVVGSIIAALFYFSPSTSKKEVVDPITYSAPFWDKYLNTDDALTATSYENLDAEKTNFSSELTRTLKSESSRLFTAQVTGANRNAFSTYFPSTADTTTTCKNLSLKAVSPAKLDLAAGLYAKVLIAWTASCPETYPGYIPDEVQVSYLYFKVAANSATPVPDWQMPRPASAASTPESYELKSFQACSSASAQFQARIIVVDAFNIMCEAAKKDKVSLKLTAALRTVDEQDALFEEAVKYYGSVSEAKKWVAASGNSCTSKHCDGLAVDVATTRDALVWLHKQVACTKDGTVEKNLNLCTSSDPVVSQMQLYGFVAPSKAIPEHLEFYLPISTSSASKEATCDPAAASVPQQIASVWRCRLQNAGITGQDQERIVAEALVVSRCESGWNPAASAFGGTYRTDPHPSTGKVYTNSGLFMLDDAETKLSTPGGLSARYDPVAGAMGGATLWLSTRSWEAFGCATGKGDLFETGPVIPQFGAPALPEWAYSY